MPFPPAQPLSCGGGNAIICPLHRRSSAANQRHDAGRPILYNVCASDAVRSRGDDEQGAAQRCSLLFFGGVSYKNLIRDTAHFRVSQLQFRLVKVHISFVLKRDKMHVCVVHL